MQTKSLNYLTLRKPVTSRKERADSIREIRRLVRKLIGEHERDLHIAEHRKKLLKWLVIMGRALKIPDPLVPGPRRGFQPV